MGPSLGGEKNARLTFRARVKRASQCRIRASMERVSKSSQRLRAGLWNARGIDAQYSLGRAAGRAPECSLNL